MNIMTNNAPDDWMLEKLGQLFEERKQKVSDKEYAPLSVTKRGIVPQMEHVAKSDDSDNRKRVAVGDFVINSRSDRRGSSGLSELDGSVSLINMVLRPRHGHPRFIHHLMRSYAFQEEFYRFGHGIVADLWTTRYSELKSITVALPDEQTQKEIADFLDHETDRIDQLIEKKQRLVKSLEERIISLAEAAITSDERATKLAHHVKILPGYAFSSSDFSTDHRHTRLLRGINVTPDKIRWDDIVFWPDHLSQGLDRFLLRKGDIVMGMDRPWVSGGIRVAEISEHDSPCYLLQRVCKITPLKTITKDFLKLLLSSKRFLGYFEPELTGVSVPHISGEQIANFRFQYIPISEQRKRTAECLQKKDKTKRIINNVNDSLARLVELRTSLITEAVTGQLDIKAWKNKGGADKRLDNIEEAMLDDDLKRGTAC